MKQQEVRKLQQKLVGLGYLEQHDVDGVWGAKTARASQQYLATHVDEEIVAAVAGDPPKAWWQSRTTLSLIATIVASGAGLAGISLDAAALAEVLFSVAAVLSGVIGLLANAKRASRIDSDILAPGVRLSRLMGRQ